MSIALDQASSNTKWALRVTSVIMAAIFCAAALIACGSDTAQESDARATRDHLIGLNQIQTLGTHNSFHPHPVSGSMSRIIKDRFPWFIGQAEYRHAPLTEQLDEMGMRHFELDVFADPDGGNFSHVPLLKSVGEPTSRQIPELDQPGFKVLHLPQIDPDSTCWTLVHCLQEIRSWSDKHPGHIPIMVMIETKYVDFLGLAKYIPIVPFTEEDFRALDREILSVFPRERLITPDDVQGDSDTLERAVLTKGWPSLAQSRGKLLFTQYHGKSHDDLRGRIMFPDSRPGQPNAAFIVLEDVVENFDTIRSAVQQGYLVRTRSDIDLEEVRTNDYSRFNKALGSGAQFISTDAPRPYPAINTEFYISLPEGGSARCNPLTAPPVCDSSELENPALLTTAPGQ